MRKAIGAAIIKDKKILLVKKGQVWILPGGKPNPGESDLECLLREIKEELSGTEAENPRYYKRFEGITPHKKDVLEVFVYFADVKGEIGRPSSEIGDRAWLDDKKVYNLPDITVRIIDSLVKDGYINTANEQT